MKKYLLALAATAVMTTPAFADYYIVQGPDKRCEIVETIPESYVQVGPFSFTSRDEAERQVEVVCKDQSVVIEGDDNDDDDTVVIERN